MKKRLVLFLPLTFLVLFSAAAGTGWGGAVEAKEEQPAVKIGLIDLDAIKRQAPPFQRLREQAKANQRLLEEFTAQVLVEHQQQLRALSSNELTRSHELALVAQARIDQKRRELEEGYRQEEAAVLAEFNAVLAKVMKDKRLDCILLKDGFQVGGEDVTEQVLKTWDKWGLTFWQRVGMFFTGKDPRTKPSKEEKAR